MRSTHGLSLITMADQPSSATAKKSKKKGRGIAKLFRDLMKQPKPANDSASQSISTPVSVSFASDALNPFTGNDAGSTKSTASSK